MKAIVFLCVLGAALVSCQDSGVDKTKLPPPPKINTRELWGKIKKIFDSLKGKLSNPENVREAEENAKDQMIALSSSIKDVMDSIGENIHSFSAKSNSHADGMKVKEELHHLGLCASEVFAEGADGVADVVKILAQKGVKAAETAKIPDQPPKELVEDLKKAAPKIVDAHEH